MDRDDYYGFFEAYDFRNETLNTQYFDVFLESGPYRWLCACCTKKPIDPTPSPTPRPTSDDGPLPEPTGGDNSDGSPDAKVSVKIQQIAKVGINDQDNSDDVREYKDR